MIYRIYANFNKYAAFKMDEFAACEFLGEDLFFLADPSPHHYAEKWQLTEISFENFDGSGKPKPIPDVINFSGRLFLNEKAFNLTKTILKNHGELLPVTYGAHKGHFYNPLCIAEDLDALDKKLSLKNNFGDLESLFFIEDKVKHLPIFKTEFDGFSGLYCNSEMKSIIESNDLVGVTFGTDLGNIFPSDDTSVAPASH